VVAHPHLGMYITGSTLGRLHLWRYAAASDQAIDEYVTDSNWRANTSDSWSISKIKLNRYGDKIAATDFEGNLYIFRLEPGHEAHEPDMVFKRATHRETLDVEFLNQGSVFCTTGMRPNHLTIYDTLLPPVSAAVMHEEVGGNIVLALHENQQLIVFNSRANGMHLYDMRMKKFCDLFVDDSDNL
jgi:hypothetical protein